VVLKDQNNKKAHESSAQLACEAAASIRTVAALTREGDCCRQYSQSLEEPLRKSNTTAPWSGLLYAFSQSSSFFVIALAFWYGSILVSRRETSPFHFFVVLMVGFLHRSSQISLMIWAEYDIWGNARW
jgi:ATP-binding cassette subfamily B (MDR/TAP) protein 1